MNADQTRVAVTNLIEAHERLHGIATTRILIVDRPGELLVDGDGVLRLPRVLAQSLTGSDTIPAALLGLPVSELGEAP